MYMRKRLESDNFRLQCLLADQYAAQLAQLDDITLSEATPTDSHLDCLERAVCSERIQKPTVTLPRSFVRWVTYCCEVFRLSKDQ